MEQKCKLEMNPVGGNNPRGTKEQERDADQFGAIITPLQPHGESVQRDLQSADSKHHSARLPPYLLQQYSKSWNVFQGSSVSYGAFGHRSNHEHVHPSWPGRCKG